MSQVDGFIRTQEILGETQHFPITPPPHTSACQAYHLVDIPAIRDHRGSLSVLEEGDPYYFDVKRVYYLYHLNEGMSRGAHAHYQLQQLIIPIAGSFKISLKSRGSSDIFLLDNPSKALYVGSMVWRDIFDFSHNAVCLVLASHPYDEADYIRDINDFYQQIGDVS